jgi:hypothetical protein
VLSLDAAAVAVVWQAAVAREAGASPGWAQVFVLGCSVWLAYTADRWIESWRAGPRPVLTPRHRFHQRHRTGVLVAMMAGLLADVAVALTWLGPDDLTAGLILTAAVLTYLVSHQWLHRHASWRVPKELLIASLLTAGVWLFVREAGPARLAVPLSLFWLLCFTNCVLISRWEAGIDRQQGQTSIALEQPAAARWIPIFPWVVTAIVVAVLAAGGSTAGFAARAALPSAVLLGVLDRLEPAIGWPAARVGADAVLLTPLVWWML